MDHGHKDTQVVFVGNQKGGVGKTTNCVHLAAALGVKVLGLYPATAPWLSGIWSPEAINLVPEKLSLPASKRRALALCDQGCTYGGHLRVTTVPALDVETVHQHVARLCASGELPC